MQSNVVQWYVLAYIWTNRRVAFILTVHTVDLFRIDLIMANKENKRKIMIAMDGSEYSEGALKCKY